MPGPGSEDVGAEPGQRAVDELEDQAKVDSQCRGREQERVQDGVEADRLAPHVAMGLEPAAAQGVVALSQARVELSIYPTTYLA